MESPDTSHHGAWFNTTSTESVADPIIMRGHWLPRALIGLLTLVSFLAPGAAGIWLALHGYRKAAAMGLLFAVGMPVVWTYIAFWPSTVIAAPVLGRGRIAHPLVVLLLSLLAAGWQYVVIAAWTFGVCTYLSRYTHPGIELQMGALAFGVVIGPLSFMAGRDAGAESAPMLAMGLALLSFATIVICHVLGASVGIPIVVLVLLVLVAAGLNASLSALAAARQRRAGVGMPDPAGGSVNRALHQVIRRAS